jgi:hypothetical protein
MILGRLQFSNGSGEWARLRKFKRKGHSCEALRLQAQSLANGPVRQAYAP